MDRVNELAAVDIDNILLPDDKHFSLGSAAQYLQKIVRGAKDITEHPGFWGELPDRMQVSLKNEADTILRNIDEIRANRENPQWLTNNLSSHISSLSNLYNTVYPWFVVAIREYMNSNDTQRKEADTLIKELRNSIKATEEKLKLATEASTLATEASSTISTVELSKFFDEIANGKSSDVAKAKKNHKRTWKYRTTSYYSEANKWLAGVGLSIITTGAVAIFIFFDLKQGAVSLEEVVARGLILAAPAYAIKFCARHYSINKNLQATNTHRAVVMKTLLAFLKREDISVDVKSSIITEAAKQAFRSSDVNEKNEGDSVIEIPVPWKKG